MVAVNKHCRRSWRTISQWVKSSPIAWLLLVLLPYLQLIVLYCASGNEALEQQQAVLTAAEPRATLEQQRAWIDVEKYSEGFNQWRQSVGQLLALARATNATFVEPCIVNGRLTSCREANAVHPRLSDVFVVDHFLAPSADGAFPVMATEVQFDHIMQRRPTAEVQRHEAVGYPGDTAMDCYDGRRVSGLGPDCDPLRAFGAALQHNSTKTKILAFTVYRAGAVKFFGGKTLKEPTLTLHPKHDAAVNALLHRAKLTGRDFGVIHWRAEKKTADYVRCAELIVKTRDLMNDSNGTGVPFFLMSSINIDPEKRWISWQVRDKTIPVAIQSLRDHEFLLLDDLAAVNGSRYGIGGRVDLIYLAIWDLLLAEKAATFATCTRGCEKENEPCAQCNVLGAYAERAIEHRRTKGKDSFKCWPSLPEWKERFFSKA